MEDIMKIYLFLIDRIVSFSLPTSVVGSFSFDVDSDEEAKLINVEARDGKWVIYSTTDVNIIDNNSIIGSLELKEDFFYVLRRNDKDHLIYIGDISLNNMSLYSYNNNLNLVIGNASTSNIQYPCPFLNNVEVKIHFVNDKLMLESNASGVYINDLAITSNSVELVIGDCINIYGLRMIFLNNLLLLGNPGRKLVVLPTTNISSYLVPQDTGTGNVEIKDIDLYDKSDYFSKSPRIRRSISTKVVKLSPPPKENNNSELPMILTIGPMLTMGITSGVMVIDVLSRIASKQTTWRDSWSSLVASSAMLVSMLVWPLVTNAYNKRMKKKKRAELVLKYGEYLTQKKEELVSEMKLQKDILIENLITVDECLNIIKSKNMNFWNKRLDQNDLLIARVGVGNELFNVSIEYPEEGFTIDEDELRKQADKLVSEFRYIENVPIGYSFRDNKLTAVMGTDKVKRISFVNNIILQFITFYSYEDLKIVIFTNEDNYKYWEYIKYLNHNLSNDKTFRFFSTTVDTSNKLADYLSNEISARSNNKNDESGNKKIYRPYYLVIVDDYERVKDYEFINILTENDKNYGFSMIIIEERLSKLPSKCNNYITIQAGSGKSGILKNTFDNQVQLSFMDEVNYNINYMDVTRIISNIPIEFEEKSSYLPDSISFMEMERVGKVEQLNILNRWNTNDSTVSLKAEIGVNDKRELMYLDLHEKYHGPHGLIAGTTGSGKSEFIITYILSMCINYSPDDVAFILIDYKGGGLALAFENKVTGIRLPHLAGTITNLDKAEMDRTLVSIDSEVKRRQRMFNEARDKLGESTIDIYKYQRHYKEGRLDEAIPHLFIICDEFAELKSQQPDFMDNLISVARIGRSLGVHLILATQKPSGVVNDQIWSNTRFRVCLKVQDESDSNEMLKRTEAAHITQAGRFYLQVGYDEIFALGQSGYSGAKYYPSDKIVKQVDKSVNFIDDCGSVIKSVGDEEIKLEAHGEQLASIMKSIIEVANSVNKRARRLWLDNIPEVILVDDLYKKYNLPISPYNLEVAIGEYDAPERQEQGLVRYNYLSNGNTIIYSQNSNESEMILNTIIYSTVSRHLATEVNFYIIDYGSESLRKYVSLPHVGGVVFNGEDDKYNNLIKMIKIELINRKKLFVNYGGDYANYVRNSNNKIPVMVVMINNFDSFYEVYQDVYDYFPELVRDSVRYGIVFIFSCSATNSIPSKISQNFNNSYAFKIKDQSDYMFIFNSKSKIVPRDIDGRGLIDNNGVHEFQTASITSTEEELNDYIIKFINYQKQINKFRAKRIPALPNFVRKKDIEYEITDLKRVPVGIMKNTLDICTVDFVGNLGTIITSNKMDNMDIFVKSLLEVFRSISGINLMIIDSLGKLNLDPMYYSNYYTDNLSEVVDKLSEYMDSIVNSNPKVEGILVLYGLSNFPACVSEDDDDEDGKFIRFLQKLYRYKSIGIVGIDEAKKIKNIQYDEWYGRIFASGSGVWIGKGAGDQSILKTDDYSKELQANYNNDMGFYIADGEAILMKLLDFVTKDGDLDG